MLRYLRRADDITRGRLRWGMLTNGRLWRLYWQGAVSVAEEFLEIDLGKVLSLPGCDSDLLDPRGLDPDHALRLFLLLFGRGAFLPSGQGRTFHAVAFQRLQPLGLRDLHAAETKAFHFVEGRRAETVLRHRSATGTPASCSRRIAMICSSLNLDRFIRPSLRWAGLYVRLD